MFSGKGKFALTEKNLRQKEMVTFFKRNHVNFSIHPNTGIAMNATTGENENLMIEKKSIMFNYNRFLIIFWPSTFYYEKFVLTMFDF